MHNTKSVLRLGIALLTSCSSWAQPLPYPHHPSIANVQVCAPTPDNYPKESLDNREQGTTRLRFDVDATGSLVAASIDRSSGHTRLDQLALKMLSACRFKPARDAEGKAVAGTFRLDYVWKLP
mgnify:CR=1 FL=1